MKFMIIKGKTGGPGGRGDGEAKMGKNKKKGEKKNKQKG